MRYPNHYSFSWFFTPCNNFHSIYSKRTDDLFPTSYQPETFVKVSNREMEFHNEFCTNVCLHLYYYNASTCYRIIIRVFIQLHLTEEILLLKIKCLKPFLEVFGDDICHGNDQWHNCGTTLFLQLINFYSQRSIFCYIFLILLCGVSIFRYRDIYQVRFEQAFISFITNSYIF